MLRQVAYDTLTKRERKTRHLAVAEHLRSSFPEDGDEVAEVIATHYHHAHTAAPTDPDAEQILDHAISYYARAGNRAGTLGSPNTAQTHYQTAARLTTNEQDRATYTESAADMAYHAGRSADALVIYETVAAAHTTAGRTTDAARLQARIGLCLGKLGRNEAGIERMRTAIAALENQPANAATLAELHAELGISFLFTNRPSEAAAHSEHALTLAAAHNLPRVLTRALGGRAISLVHLNRVVEAVGVMGIAIDVAHEHNLTYDEETQWINAGDMRNNSDLPGAVEALQAGLVLARRIGDADGQGWCLHNLAIAHLAAGGWDEADTHAQQAVSAAPDGPTGALVRWPLVVLHSLRGQRHEAENHMSQLEQLADSDDMQDRAALNIGRAVVAITAGNPEDALANAGEEARNYLGFRTEGFRWAWPLALEAALAAGRLDDAAGLLAPVADAPVGHVPPYLRAQLARYTALLNAARHQDDTVEADLRQAITILTDLDYAYWLARAEADLADWLITRHRPDDAEPLLAAATDTFSRLGAQPDLDRTRATASAQTL
jgi:tetratricopeptide (TPR) repeat protein